ncbi:MAG: EB domain-containing protein [Polyangiaceae bacterium]
MLLCTSCTNSDASKSRAGESCTKTDDCAGGARCVAQICVIDGAPGPVTRAPATSGPQTLEELARAIVAGLRAPATSDYRSLELRALAMTGNDVDQLVAAHPEIGPVPESERAKLRGLPEELDKSWREVRAKFADYMKNADHMEFVRLSAGRVEVDHGVERVRPDLGFVVSCDGREFEIGVEGASHAPRGWVITAGPIDAR